MEKEKLIYAYTMKDDSIIMDTNVCGRDFGNDGFGGDVLEKCNEYGESLIGKHIKYNDKDYHIVAYEIAHGFIGYWGSIFVKLKEITNE